MRICLQFIQFLALGSLILNAACTPKDSSVSTQTQPIPVSLAPSDQAKDYLAEHARIRERNLGGPPMTTDELHQQMAEPKNADVLKRWKETRSYYALLEIVEGLIEPEIGSLRRQDVEELLGKGDPDYPNSNGHMLHYAGERRVEMGAHVLIEFDEKGIVKDLDWVSE